MNCDHAFLVGGDDEGLDPALGGADQRLTCSIGAIIDLKAQPLEPATNKTAHARVIFADASSKDDPVHTLQRSGKGAGVTGDAGTVAGAGAVVGAAQGPSMRRKASVIASASWLSFRM